MPEGQKVASLYADIGASITGFQSGAAQVRQGLTGLKSDFQDLGRSISNEEWLKDPFAGSRAALSQYEAKVAATEAAVSGASTAMGVTIAGGVAIGAIALGKMVMNLGNMGEAAIVAGERFDYVKERLDPTTTSAAKLTDAWHDLRVEMGKPLVPFTSGINQGITGQMDALTAWLQRQSTDPKNAIKGYQNLLSSFQADLAKAKADPIARALGLDNTTALEEKIQLLKDTIYSMQGALTSDAAALVRWQAAQDAATAAGNRFVGTLLAQVSASGRLARETAPSIWNYGAAATGLGRGPSGEMMGPSAGAYGAGNIGGMGPYSRAPTTLNAEMYALGKRGVEEQKLRDKQEQDQIRLNDQIASAAEAAWRDAVGKVQTAFEEAIGYSKGLGTMAGPLAPGQNGPFEAIYRIQDVAQNLGKMDYKEWTDAEGVKHTAKESEKWAAMYGVDQGQAQEIVKQFQGGNWEQLIVAGLIDVDKLKAYLAQGKIGEQFMQTFAESLADATGMPAESVKGKLGFKPGTAEAGAAGIPIGTINVTVAAGAVTVAGGDATGMGELIGQTIAGALKALSQAEQRVNPPPPPRLPGNPVGMGRYGG